MAVINSSNTFINFNLVNNFIHLHPRANFFQSPGYYLFCKSLSSFDPIIIISTDEAEMINGTLVAVIHRGNDWIKTKLSSRCIVYGGPIVKDDEQIVTNILLKELIKNVRSKSIYIEFRNLFDMASIKSEFIKNGFNYKQHYNFIVEIGSTAESYRKLNDNRRRQIKKSLDNGAEIITPKELREVEEFYLILKKLYKVKVKKPLPEFQFFENFFLNSTLGKYFLIKYNKEIIGGIMCPIYKDTLYEWYICGLDSEFKNQSPSVLATWAPIEFATKNNLKYFDFLGAGTTDTDYGVREFKSKFGGSLVQYGRFLRINNRLLYNIGKFGLKVLEQLK